MSRSPKPGEARSRQLTALPPAARSPAALELTAAAARGRFELQVCAECGAAQYPPREACHRCLSTALTWMPQPSGGELMSETRLHHSHEPYFSQRLPWRIGMVRLDCGPTAITHVAASVPSAPCRVRLLAQLDDSGQAVLVATAEPDASPDTPGAPTASGGGAVGEAEGTA
jgi:uncharacterized OB-fold protein